MSCLPKPVLRGHCKKRGLKGIIGALTFAAMNATLFKVLVINPRNERLEEFMKTYDAKAHSRDLIEWGYFQTISSEDLRQEE